MPAVHLNHLSFRHSRAVDILVDVDADLGPGWTGVVGANGAGKTTFLELISGDLQPTAGSIALDPTDGIVILCPQTVDSMTRDVETLALSWDGPDVSLRGRLQLEPDDLARWPTLSPGERKRWQIGAALARRPDFLLLDEPTNHLDTDGRTRLVSALARFDGVGLLVSHDRDLLNELMVRTLRIEHGRVTLWNGRYDTAREAWEAIEAADRKEFERLQLEKRKAERRLVEQRQVNEQKRAAFKRRNNTSSFKDIDGRSAARQNKHREGEKAAGKILASSTKGAERAADAVAVVEWRKTVGGEISFDHAPAPKRLLARHTGPLTAGSKMIVAHVDLTIERGDRIWLRGPNGAGKTTLLRTLIENTTLPEDRVFLLEQEMTSEEASLLMLRLRGLDTDHRGRVLSIVAALGVDPEVLLASDNPSPGEARKLAIALGLGRQAWLVALDEPTNHLDLPSIERLERALASYPGALIVITHDTQFAGTLELAEFELE